MQLARRAGISKATLERIENRQYGDVRLWHLVNLALVLGCDLYDVIDDRWLVYRHTNVAVPLPKRTSLPRPAGGREPRHMRQRARGRSSGDRPSGD